MKFDIKRVKIIVTIPVGSVDIVRNSMCEAGAGIIGNYTYCSTSVKSLGTFVPNNNAKPYLGEINKLEYVEEERLECVCDINNVKRVLTAIRLVHPYEEPAIDIVPLMDEKDFGTNGVVDGN